MKKRREIALQKILQLEFNKKTNEENHKQKKKVKIKWKAKKKTYLVRKTEFYENLEMQRLETLKKELLKKGTLSDDQMTELENLSKQQTSNNDTTQKLYKSGYFSGFIH